MLVTAWTNSDAGTCKSHDNFLLGLMILNVLIKPKANTKDSGLTQWPRPWANQADRTNAIRGLSRHIPVYAIAGLS